MGDFQSFGYKGIPGTCLWCGRKLHYRQIMAEEGEPGAKFQAAYFWTKRAANSGNYQDNSFCGLRCGYQFGVRFAHLGRRLGSAT